MTAFPAFSTRNQGTQPPPISRSFLFRATGFRTHPILYNSSEGRDKTQKSRRDSDIVTALMWLSSFAYLREGDTPPSNSGWESWRCSSPPANRYYMGKRLTFNPVDLQHWLFLYYAPSVLHHPLLDLPQGRGFLLESICQWRGHWNPASAVLLHCASSKMTVIMHLKAWISCWSDISGRQQQRVIKGQTVSPGFGFQGNV